MTFYKETNKFKFLIKNILSDSYKVFKKGGVIELKKTYKDI